MAKKSSSSKRRSPRSTAAGSTTRTKKKTTGKKVATTKKKAPAKKVASKKAPARKKNSDAQRKRGRSVLEAALAETPDKKGYVCINGRRVRVVATTSPVRPAATRAGGTRKEATAEVSKPTAIKTHLTARQLRGYRELLETKRAELMEDVGSMESQALRSSSGEISHMPIHMADIGSDAFDQDLKLGVAASERDRIRMIDEALSRIGDRTYGVCPSTGTPIPTARLKAKPWAKYTIDAARRIEQGLVD